MHLLESAELLATTWRELRGFHYARPGRPLRPASGGSREESSEILWHATNHNPQAPAAVERHYGELYPHVYDWRHTPTGGRLWVPPSSMGAHLHRADELRTVDPAELPSGRDRLARAFVATASGLHAGILGAQAAEELEYAEVASERRVAGKRRAQMDAHAAAMAEVAEASYAEPWWAELTDELEAARAAREPEPSAQSAIGSARLGTVPAVLQ